MKNKTNKRTMLVCLVVSACLLLSGTMAYFTDRATLQAQGTAGTVAIAVDSHINMLNEDGMDILNPGDLRDAGFDVINKGNKSVDVRETIAITAYDYKGDPMNFTGSSTTQSEFDLYLRDDVSYIEGEGWKPNADAAPLEIKSIDGNVITYTRPEYSLNGNDEMYDEVETIDGVDSFMKENDFVLIFKGETGNDWQGANIKMDVLVEAKQHENTGAGWDIVAKEDFTAGSIEKETVLPEEIITPTPEVEVEKQYVIIEFYNGIYNYDSMEKIGEELYTNDIVEIWTENLQLMTDENGQIILEYPTEIDDGYIEVSNGSIDVGTAHITGPGTYKIVFEPFGM